jgi:hypothetical protein
MPIMPGLKAHPVSFIDRAFSPSVPAGYNPGALPQAGMVRAFSAGGKTVRKFLMFYHDAVLINSISATSLQNAKKFCFFRS